MKTAGEILRHARERKKLTLHDIAAATAIDEKYLHAIELNAFRDLPNDVSTYGFLSLYAGVVALDPKAVIALYRRDVPEKSPDHPRLRSHFFVLGRQRLVRFFISAMVVGAAMGLLIFSAIFITRLRQAPPLKIQTPQNEAKVVSPVFLRGVTSSDAVVHIDGESTGVNQDGVFTKDIELSSGVHIITVKATGRNGKDRLVQLVLNVE